MYLEFKGFCVCSHHLDRLNTSGCQGYCPSIPQKWCTGALHRPKAITLNCQSPLPAVKAVFSWSCSSTSSCQYPLLGLGWRTSLNQIKHRELCLRKVKGMSPSWSVRLISVSRRKIAYCCPFSSLGRPVKPMGRQRVELCPLHASAQQL